MILTVSKFNVYEIDMVINKHGNNKLWPIYILVSLNEL